MRYLYRTYQLFIAAPLLLLITVLTAIVIIVGCTISSSPWCSYFPGKLWGRAIIRFLLLPVHVEGREHMNPHQSYVIVPNHQGAFDIFLIYGFLGRHFKWVLKKELRSIPLIGKACEKAGFIFVDHHGGPKKIQETCARAREILKEGVSIVIFPEGARTWDGNMRTFKRGAFQFADQLDLPLLPVTINGSFQVLPRSKGFNFVEYHPLTLTIHEPVTSEGHGAEAERATMEHVHNIIGSSLKPVKMLALTFLTVAMTSCHTPALVTGTTNLHQLEGRMLYVKVYQEGTLRDIDSTRIIHGRFGFTQNIDTTTMASLFLGEESMMPIVLDGHELTVCIDEKRNIVAGSPLNDSLFAFIKRKGEIDDQIAALPRRESQMLLAGQSHDDVLRQLRTEATVLHAQEDEIITRFIKQNMDNVLGPGVFMIMTSELPYPYMTPQVEEIITFATPAFLANPYVRDFIRIARENTERDRAIAP